MKNYSDLCIKNKKLRKKPIMHLCKITIILYPKKTWKVTYYYYVSSYMTYKIIYKVYFFICITYSDYFHKMSVLFNVVFKWGNIQLIFVMHYKKFIAVFKWGSLRLYLWCIIKGSSNIIMGYKYDIIYISFSLFTNFLFTNHFFTSGLFNTSYISFL